MKNVYFSKLLILLLGVTFISCDQRKNSNCTEFEQDVFYEIFPAVIDSLFMDRRLMPPAPPPPGLSNEEFEQWMQSEEHAESLKDWFRKRDSLKQDLTLIYFAVSDSVVGANNLDPQSLIDVYSNIEPTIQPSECTYENNFKINLSKLRSINPKLRFKYRSEFPDGRAFWRADYDFFVGAKIGFSRMLFDRSRSYGMLTAGFNYGIHNGYGYRIFIRKNKNEQWIIDEIKRIWIS